MAATLDDPMPQTTYTFLVRSLSFRDVSRTVELRGDQTLADLQGVMEAEFDLDDEHLWAFYLSGEFYDRDSEFGRSGRAHDVELRSLGLEPGLRIVHLHDFGDELRHVVDVSRVGEVQAGAEYPRVTARRGEIERAPPWEDEEEEGEPFAPELVAEVKSAIAACGSGDPEVRERAFQASAAVIDAALARCTTKGELERLGRCVEGPFPAWVDAVVHRFVREGSTAQAIAVPERIAVLLEYEPFPSKVLGEALEAAVAWDELEYEAEIDLPAPRLAELVRALLATGKTPRRVEELSNLVGRPLVQLLSRAVDQLAAAGRFEEASEAAVWLDDADGSPGEIVTVALCLARADRRDEARALLARAEAMASGLSAQASESIAQAYASAGDDAAAEDRLRRVARRRWIAAQDRDAVVGLLAELLDRTGRGSEARAAEAEHAAWQRRRLEARGGTVRRTEPRVGRNDPCPCGSGRKSKKCCGSAAPGAAQSS
jgi:hypothetical protein